MKLTDIAELSRSGVSERKFRFALNLLGILIGCMAVTGLISITQTMNNEITGQLDILGANTVMVIPSDDISVTSGSQVMSNVQYLSWRDKQLLSQYTEVESIAAIQSNYCQYDITGKKYKAQIMGVDKELFDINSNFEILEGRSFTRNDKASVIIGANIAQPEGEDEPILEVGDRLHITTLGTATPKELTLRVIGITKKSGNIMGAVNPDEILVIPLRTSEQLYDASGQYVMIQVLISNPENVNKIATKIEEDFEDVSAISSETALETVGNITNVIESVLGGIAAISLIVAGVGIVNTMTVSVSERTREIGVLKAIGAKNNDVLQIFLSEASYTGILGGFIGGGLGFIIAQVISNYIGLSMDLSLSLWFYVVVFAFLTSILAGIWPAWRASNLDPVDALRQE